MKGRKVVLREKRMEDVVADYAWKSDIQLARLDAVPPLEMPFVHFSLTYKEELHRPDPRSHRFAIDTLEGKHIGNCMYYGLDTEQQETEVGILIGDPQYWSKGYGTEAMTMLLDHLFQNMNMKRVYLHTLDWNTRAQKSFKKCGFLPCSRIIRGGHEFVVMDLHRSRWEKETSPRATVESAPD